MYEFSLKQGTKLRDLRLKQGQGLNTHAAPPYTNICWVPPPEAYINVYEQHPMSSWYEPRYIRSISIPLYNKANSTLETLQYQRVIAVF